MVISFILILFWAFFFFTLLVGSFVPFISSWASLAHSLSLDIFNSFSNSAFLWVFTNSLRLSGPNYLILHPWGSWVFHQPFNFFTCITSGLLWPILTFLHHMLPMGLLIFSPGSFRPVCFLNAHLFILYAYDPLFLPLEFNSFSIHSLTLLCPHCWASSFYQDSQNEHQHLATIVCHIWHPTVTEILKKKIIIIITSIIIRISLSYSFSFLRLK